MEKDQKMLCISIAVISNPDLEFDDIFTALYYNGTEEELDEDIKNKNMIKLYVTNDIENDSSHWKFNADRLSEYFVDASGDKPKDKKVVKDNVVTGVFKH